MGWGLSFLEGCWRLCLRICMFWKAWVVSCSSEARLPLGKSYTCKSECHVVYLKPSHLKFDGGILQDLPKKSESIWRWPGKNLIGNNLDFFHHLHGLLPLLPGSSPMVLGWEMDENPPTRSQDRAPDEPDMTPPEILTFVGMPADMIEARSLAFFGAETWWNMVKHGETDGNPPPKKKHPNSWNLNRTATSILKKCEFLHLFEWYI